MERLYDEAHLHLKHIEMDSVEDIKSNQDETQFN